MLPRAARQHKITPFDIGRKEGFSVAFSPAFLDELVARNPIEDVVGQYVTLTRKGSNLFGLCPFHSEKTGSSSA